MMMYHSLSQKDWVIPMKRPIVLWGVKILLPNWDAFFAHKLALTICLKAFHSSKITEMMHIMAQCH
jgi:hypothetical protein